MQKTYNYRTSHPGIAAYISSLGHEITKIIKGKDQEGRDRYYFEFDISGAEGKEMGDDFFSGNATGRLKPYFVALSEVRRMVYEFREADKQ